MVNKVLVKLPSENMRLRRPSDGSAAGVMPTMGASRTITPKSSGSEAPRPGYKGFKCMVIIGVARLQNLSPDVGQDFFAEGLTDEILTQLGQLNPTRLGVVRYVPQENKQGSQSAAGEKSAT